MRSPSPSRFAALARSSPWLWHSLVFTLAWQGRHHHEPVRAWVRRPDCLRVEDLAGNLRHAGRERQRGSSPHPRGLVPERDEAGLVLRRPSPFPHDYDDPMYESYFWVSMLDPVELADGYLEAPDQPAPAPVAVEQLRQVDHHGRTAWEAVLRTTDSYDPRCTCCALLFGAESERRAAEEGGPTLRSREPELRYAEAYRVRLDTGTGVCVLTEELGGSYPGTGHDLRIEAVDEPLDGALFSAPRQRRWPRRRWRRWWRRAGAAGAEPGLAP